MIELCYDIMISIHVVSGFIALIAFWLPLGLRKGSRLHRWFGWSYVVAMVIVSLTAMLLALLRLSGLKMATSEELQFAWFLLLLGWVSVGSAWQGVVALRRHWWQSFASRIEWISGGFAVLLGVGSLLLSVHGIIVGNLLLVVFPLLSGFSLSVQMLWMLWLAPTVVLTPVIFLSIRKHAT